jgi:hypothetical protein
MSSTLIITDDVTELSEPELRSKFLQLSNDVARLEKTASDLPLARASMHVVSRELVLRRLRGPRLG